jgi:geranylgeranyl pyrophosphate synthase
MELSNVYALVQPGLDAVEAEFHRLIDSQRDFPEMQRMLQQILVGGKVVRPTLTLLAGSFYHYDEERLRPMAISSELMHIATLVHDDAIDSADVRRGRPTINSVWGVDLAILLGDYLFSKAGDMAANTGSIRTVKLFTQTLGIIARGEVKQAFSSFALAQTNQQYIDRIAAKTAALFTMATESGAVLSSAPEEEVQILRNYGYNLGIAFQIVDDILDYIGTEAEVGKPVGADLAQGTITLPAMKLLQRFPGNNPIEKLAKKEDVKLNVQRAIEMVRHSSIIDECYRDAAEYARRATCDLNQLPVKPAREALYFLAEYILRRKE